MKAVERFLQKWGDAGYGDVTANLWRGVRLYVNVKGEPPFCYQMDKRAGRGGFLPIASAVKLPSALFNDARKIGHFISENREEIMEEMKDGSYYASQPGK